MDSTSITTLGIPYWDADGTAVHFLDDEGFIGIGYDSIDELRYMPLATGMAEVIWAFRDGLEACVVIEPGKMFFTSLRGTLHRLERNDEVWTETLIGGGIWDTKCLAYSPQHHCVAVLSPNQLVIIDVTDFEKLVIVQFDVLDKFGLPSLKSVAWHPLLDSFLVVSKEAFHLVSPKGERKTLLSTSERMLAAAYSPKSRTVIWCSENGRNCTTVSCARIDSINSILWNHQLVTFDNYEGETREDLIGAGIVITESTETIVLAVERKLRRYSMSGELLAPEISLSVSVSGLAVAQDAAVIAVGGRMDKCYCYNWDGTLRHARTSHQRGVMHLNYSTWGDYLYSASSGAELKCWSVADSGLRWSRPAVREIIEGWHFSEGQGAICTLDITSSESFLSEFDTSDGHTLKKFRVASSFPSVKFVGLEDLYVLTRDGIPTLSRIEIWDPATGQMIAHRELSKCEWSHLIAAGNMAIAADGHHIWLIRFEAKTLKVTELPLPSPGHNVYAMNLLDAESLIISTQFGVFAGRIQAGRWKKIEAFDGRPRCFSPGKAGRIAVYYEDSIVEVRESSSFQVIWSHKTAERHHDVSAIDLSPDGKQLAFGVDDGTIKLVTIP